MSVWTFPHRTRSNSVAAAQLPQPVSSRGQIYRTSETDALEVISTSVLTNDFVKVSLKNVSNKNVNGIQLAINGGILQVEFLDATRPDDQRIPAGGIYEETFPFNGAVTVEVAILAVTFDDNTSSGIPSLADEIFDTRRGVKQQLKRFESLLGEARKYPDADSIAVLDHLRTQVEDLPAQDLKESGAMRMGQLQAKQEIIQEIDFMKERLIRDPGSTTVSQTLSEIESRHEQRLRTIEGTTKQ